MDKMKSSAQMQLARISLGTEEISLVFGLAGRPDLGRAILAEIYKEQDEAYINALLASASHSLLARGLCHLPPNGGQPVLEKQLLQVITPLLKYDYFLFFSLVSSEQNIKVDLRVQKNEDFTSWVNKDNKVHLLENTGSRFLVDYLMSVLGKIAGFSEFGTLSFSGPINLDEVSQAIEKPEAAGSISSLLEKKESWSAEQSVALSEDLSNHLLRGTLIKVIADSSKASKEYAHLPRPTLLFLRGKQRTWTFEFPSSDPGTSGTASLVDQAAFSRILTDFLK